jgi:hypothetical protein
VFLAISRAYSRYFLSNSSLLKIQGSFFYGPPYNGHVYRNRAQVHKKVVTQVSVFQFFLHFSCFLVFFGELLWETLKNLIKTDNLFNINNWPLMSAILNSEIIVSYFETGLYLLEFRFF